MLIRLGSTVAIGISTAVYSSVGEAQANGSDPVVPYRMAFFVSVGLAGLSCLLLPFMRIGTQGNAPADKVAAEEMTASMGLANPNATGETAGDEKADKGPAASGAVTEKEQ